MARVPTWTELRLDAAKLTNLQKECYHSVHSLLDSAIPELDRKISALYNIVQGTSDEIIEHPGPRSIEQHDLNLDEPGLPEVVPEKNDESDLRAMRHPEPPTKSHKELAGRKHHKPPTRRQNRRDLDELEHLKPLPLPLSEYLRINRPDIVMRANLRVMYLQKKLERRKFLASTRITSAFGQTRLSSRNSNDYVAPEYHVKYKLSEQEMKRLTARIYKRLPEVKRKRREEVTNHIRVQNYKNKLEYGRKLLENRRHGIINYPLRATNDDSLSYDDSL